MFKLDPSPTYHAPVSITLWDEDGALQNHIFSARFTRLSQAEGQAMYDQALAGELNDQKVLDRVLVGYRDVQDAAGNELQYTPENTAALLNVAGMRKAMALSFFNSLSPADSAALAQKN